MIEIMKEAHRKPRHPARAARVAPGNKRAAHGNKRTARGTKRVTWWDQNTTESFMTFDTAQGPKTKLSMTPRHGYDHTAHMLGPKTKSTIANRPKVRCDGHGPTPKTNSFIAKLRSVMANDATTTNIQQPDTKSSRCGVSDIIRRLSYLV